MIHNTVKLSNSFFKDFEKIGIFCAKRKNQNSLNVLQVSETPYKEYTRLMILTLIIAFIWFFYIFWSSVLY
jgi:hypothetical protein